MISSNIIICNLNTSNIVLDAGRPYEVVIDGAKIPFLDFTATLNVGMCRYIKKTSLCIRRSALSTSWSVNKCGISSFRFFTSWSFPISTDSFFCSEDRSLKSSIRSRVIDSSAKTRFRHPSTHTIIPWRPPYLKKMMHWWPWAFLHQYRSNPIPSYLVTTTTTTKSQK